jgi:DNA-directed RNA polymerase subunit RPC12/RpoP
LGYNKLMDDKSKSTIYIATPVNENMESQCPHCKAKVKITKRIAVVECPSCSNYMHVVFVSKKPPTP